MSWGQLLELRDTGGGSCGIGYEGQPLPFVPVPGSDGVTRVVNLTLA